MASSSVTPSERKLIKQIIADSVMYDVRTLQISKNGEVTAKRDADKCFCGNDRTRYFLGWVDDVISWGSRVQAEKF